MDDRQLLQEYRERQSESAFAELVARHLRLVYATALRIVGEPQAAQDVAQAVFLLLARKSWMVRDGNALPGWLYRATHRTALNELRKEKRRRERETEAMTNADLDASTQATLARLLPLLDEALRQLNPVEQNLIILRFFENQSLREAGASAGLSEQAAHNRIARAVAKLRRYFARSGVTVASGAVVTALTAPSSQAVPAGLAVSVTGAALAGSGGALSLLDLILKFFLTMNTKTQIALGLVVVGLLTLPFLRSANVPGGQPTAAPQTPAAAQPELLAAADTTSTNNPTVPSANQPNQSRQISPPTQPRVALPPGSGTNMSPSPTRATDSAQAGFFVETSAAPSQLQEAQQYARNHPLSHNMGVRITGTLGPNNPVDVTLVGNRNNVRTVLYEPQNGVYAIDERVPTRGQFNTQVSPRDGSYQVIFSADLVYQQGVRTSSTRGMAILQPGESTTASSDDGQINLKATLIEIPATDTQARAPSGAGQNLMLRIHGTALAGYPFDIHLAFAAPTPDVFTAGVNEIHSIGANVLDNGVVQPVEETTLFQISPPQPDSGADPGSYEVQYALQYIPPGTTSNAAGKIVQLYNGAGECTGLVLLKVGQSATVQDVAGVGNIEISLSAADY